jgi:endogenous inhibitor of DNA gyrase (YacG/DUF329 family)
MAAPRPLTVDCPACRRPTVYGPDNAWRPFCSERCRRADLGAWANEEYRVPAQSPPDGEPGDAGDSSQALASQPPRH